MQFLYPIGLVALAGLVIPLVIHLWNIKQGKTLKIGSIALLGESSPASARSLRVNDWFLLVLRCLILILIALLLTQPFFKKVNSTKQAGWILTEKVNFPKVFQQNRKLITSLIKSGYEVHDFNVGFVTLSLKDTVSSDSSGISKLSYSALLSQLNEIIPSGCPIYLFSDQKLNRLGDQLPKITYKLTWKPIGMLDTSGNWQTTYAGKDYKAESNPSGTIYTVVNNHPATPISVALYEPVGGTDKQYLIAALKAIANYSGRQIEFSIKGKADLGFWLSEKAVSPAFKAAIKNPGVLFQYESGKVVNENSFIYLNDQNIPLNKRTKTSDSFVNIWTDGFGNPILTKSQSAELQTYHFYSRFNPQWNELVWNEAFIKAIMPMVIIDHKAGDFGFEYHNSDKRSFSSDQIRLLHQDRKPVIQQTVQNESLSNLLWAIALFTIMIERILSFRKKNKKYA